MSSASFTTQRFYTCGVPGCKNKGTVGLPSNAAVKEEWYRILHLSRKSKSHRICLDHFDGRDIGISGTTLKRNVIPKRNLPLNSVSLHTTNTVLSFLTYFLSLFFYHLSFSFPDFFFFSLFL